ncbi:hypothetical protein [Raoultella ornithinolytica]|uniref:hypothetical protein n=1 Tax=Raoultella ornithinolytica TaxID=54291 RepID=UPI0016426A18|nr:hypothetical protein [Raoultella ornithinolytica]EKW1873220.1 hypothetical protein [Raoultella ornithinolytica]MEB6435858.1 hypothetical protein [Raoultella ornithinolytica]HCE8956473.1 hypothetical protein [Raoultella ornithinolytica]
MFDAWPFMAGFPARHPSGRCFATFKSAPGGFVLLKESLTDKQQIKQKAQSFD